MLAQVMPRQPAPMLARGAPWLRLGGRPTAFGNALGNAVVDSMTTQNTAQESFRQSEIRKQNAEHEWRQSYFHVNGSDVESDNYRDPVAGPGLQPRRSSSGIQLSGGAMNRWSNDIDTSIANRAKELANIDQAQRFLSTMPLAALDINEGDPTPLHLRSPAEFRDLGRSVWNGVVGAADFGLMMGRGALRLYDKNPDGSPNLKSLTAPILDGLRLDYESESYRSGGLSFFGETLTQVVAPSAFARLPGAVRGLAGEIRGAGFPDWNIGLDSPYQLNSIGGGLKFERIGSLADDLANGFKPAPRSGLDFRLETRSHGDTLRAVDLFSRQRFAPNGEIVSRPYDTSFIMTRFDEATGRLYIDKMAAQPGHHIGREMISNVIESVGPQNIRIIEAEFADTNWEVFKASLNAKMTPMEAAQSTPLGKALSDLGYGNRLVDVKNGYPRPQVRYEIRGGK